MSPKVSLQTTKIEIKDILDDVLVNVFKPKHCFTSLQFYISNIQLLNSIQISDSQLFQCLKIFPIKCVHSCSV